MQNPGASNQEIHELRFGSNTIGREIDNTIVVIHKSLSRYHAKVTIADDLAIVTDLGSVNKTFVNQINIAQCELKDGDFVRFGSVVFKFLQKLESFAQEPLGDEDSNLSIVSRISPEQTRVVLQDLLHPARLENQGSALNLRQQDANHRAVDKLKILLEVSQQLSSPEEPEKLLEKILNLLLEIMNVDRAAILLVSEATEHLERKAVKSRSGIPEDNQFYSTKITNFVRHKGEAILSTDARSDKRFSGSDSILMQAIHASMCVPLKP